MTKEDVRIIFGNISELAVFADAFVEKLEVALGNVLQEGKGPDSVGALFLEIVRPPVNAVDHDTEFKHGHRYPISKSHITLTSRDIPRRSNT